MWAIWHISARTQSPLNGLRLSDTSEKHLGVFKHKNHGLLCQHIPHKVMRVLEAQNCTLIKHGDFCIFFSPSIEESVRCLQTFSCPQPLTSSKGLRDFLSGCSGSVLWKAGNNLTKKWVNISLEYPSYAGLLKRQGKVKTQQLPLSNFCKSEETRTAQSR